MEIIWMPEALQDLQSIKVYIEKDSLIQSYKVVTSIVMFTQTRLETFPLSGRAGRVVNTLELVIPKLSYFVPYRISLNTIEILRVYHTSRSSPEHF